MLTPFADGLAVRLFIIMYPLLPNSYLPGNRRMLTVVKPHNHRERPYPFPHKKTGQRNADPCFRFKSLLNHPPCGVKLSAVLQAC